MTPSPSHPGGTRLRICAAAMRYVHWLVFPQWPRYRFGVHFDGYADSVSGLLAEAIVVGVGGLSGLVGWGIGCLGFVFAERIGLARAQLFFIADVVTPHSSSILSV